MVGLVRRKRAPTPYRCTQVGVIWRAMAGSFDEAEILGVGDRMHGQVVGWQLYREGGISGQKLPLGDQYQQCAVPFILNQPSRENCYRTLAIRMPGSSDHHGSLIGSW
jgi:hypothetical protein